jgi:arylsulfatase B/arylsulfatase I/J
MQKLLDCGWCPGKRRAFAFALAFTLALAPLAALAPPPPPPPQTITPPQTQTPPPFPPPLLPTLPATPPPRRPHIVFLVADDLGYNDVGYHQNKVSGANPLGRATVNASEGLFLTPTIDGLAAEGSILESYYVQPLCSPTRGTIMTGRYPSHTGFGPDIDDPEMPFAMPAAETFLPERLRAAGYATHAVGKYHLGACDARYLATFRGFDSYFGYLAGAEDYYIHAGDFRVGQAAGEAPACAGRALDGRYSTTLFSGEADRVIRAHNASTPLFLYVAFQNVHNPYEAPPVGLVNVSEVYKNISDPGRRLYAGMVTALDLAVLNVTRSLQAAGLWDDTVLVFTTDNGGIAFGNNYPLRGAKVYNWEGGVRGVAFVRGTNSALAPVQAGAVRSGLLHSTDWFATLCGLAQVATATAFPLDGFDVWPTIAVGAASPRTSIVHNAPVGAVPVLINNGSAWSTSTCISGVDPAVNALGGCHAFGITGAAVRLGDFKLLITNGSAPWGDSSQPMDVLLPAGFRPNPPPAPAPAPVGGLFLFDIASDPTESSNLAASMPAKVGELLAFYRAYAATARPALSWRWSFADPASRTNFSGGCAGPLEGSRFCSYGHEFGCFISGFAIAPGPQSTVAAATPEACQAACVRSTRCEWFVFRAQEGGLCDLHSTRASEEPCADCMYGPATCPGE